MNSRSNSVSRSPASPISSIRAYCRRLPCLSCCSFTSGVKASSAKRRLIVPPDTGKPHVNRLYQDAPPPHSIHPLPALLPVSRSLQRGDIQLHHPHHRVHHALRLRLVGIVQHRVQRLRRNLPRHTELVRQPTASHRLAAIRQL